MPKHLTYILVPLVAMIVLLAGYTAFQSSSETKTLESAPSEAAKEGNAASGAPFFSWTYVPFEEAEIPRTKIGIIATYPDGTTRSKEIDVIEGNCNAYSSPDADVYMNSEMIICYYAGFGRYYKVVEKGSTYEVQRREFEEASPDYNPPVANFETIATF